MNKVTYAIFFIVLLSVIFVFGKPACANKKHERLQKYKDSLEVELKLIRGNHVKEKFGIKGVDDLSYYVFGSVFNKNRGIVWVELEVYVPSGGGYSYKYPVKLELPHGSKRERCVFLIYAGDIRPYQLEKTIVGYNITNFKHKG